MIQWGKDTILALEVLLTLRVQGAGRGAEFPQETEWLQLAAHTVIERTTEYLMSEYVGDYTLEQLVQMYL